MSDGPHRSLNMNRRWKRLAECADKDAYSLQEVADAFTPALEQNWREEVPQKISNDLLQIFSDQQHALFNEQRVDQIAALRPSVVGRPLGCALLDCAMCVANSGANGPEALVQAATDALLNRGSRGARQVEEHYYRKSTARRSMNVRERIDRAMKNAALDSLARQCLKMSPAQKPRTTKKQQGLDDGVHL